MILKEPRTIHVAADSALDVGALLAEAKERPLILEQNGVRFRLTREEADEDFWAAYDPEAARQALRETVGSWADIDADALITLLYQAREEGSRSPGRPGWPICSTPTGPSRRSSVGNRPPACSPTCLANRSASAG